MFSHLAMSVQDVFKGSVCSSFHVFLVHTDLSRYNKHFTAISVFPFHRKPAGGLMLQFCIVFQEQLHWHREPIGSHSHICIWKAHNLAAWKICVPESVLVRYKFQEPVHGLSIKYSTQTKGILQKCVWHKPPNGEGILIRCLVHRTDSNYSTAWGRHIKCFKYSSFFY